MAKHASPEGSAVAAAWSVLVVMGGTSVTFQIWHSVHGGRLVLPLALLYGIAPVFAAMFLSHMAAAHDGGTWMRRATFAVMVGAMTMSIGSIAAVVRPTSGPYLEWLFGAVLDAAALIALRVILTERQRETARQAAAEADALARGQQAEADEIGTARAAAQEAAEKAVLLEAELAESRAALEAERNRAPKRPRKRNSAAGTGRRSTAITRGGTDDANVEAEALTILDADRSITGAELARRLSVSEGYGRRLKRDLAPSLNGSGGGGQ